ncbi:NUDIX domain-containing protein [Raineyella fluvialis]|uniref:NUDIX domain-containing protein n=1 Tax=Raineyella fluvialis TaxID=2662261 RepID=A0A5Q2FIA4_9ACTN|nr:NUDIX domain-containing protein [Raineyella fluvialis]
MGWPVVSRHLVGEGAIFDLVRDQVVDPSGAELRREWIRHPGAVGVIALDDDDRIVLVRQYRHAAGLRLVEPPAGLLDVDGEDYVAAARRELAEEVGLRAADWRVLVDMFTSPGASQEGVRIYLARDLHPEPQPTGFVADGEEAHMDIVRADFDDVVDAILDGRLQNPVLVAGVMAAAAARPRGWDRLRNADAPWPARRLREEFLARAPFA